MAQQASSWKQVLPKIGPTIIYIRRNFDTWVMQFYLSSFPLVGKASIPYICPENRVKKSQPMPVIGFLVCLYDWWQVRDHQIGIYLYVAKSWTKKYQIEANLQLIWAGCHSYCQGTCFSTYTPNLTKNSTHSSAPLLQNKQTVFHNIWGTFGCVC